MAHSATHVRRPKRWDVPFSAEMTPAEVERLLRLDLFSSMDRSRFSKHCSLQDILLNDARVVRFEPGDLIVREGDYGSSAFIVLRGAVRVAVDALPQAALGRAQQPKKSLFRSLFQGIFARQTPEVRTYGHSGLDSSIGQRNSGEHARIFLQDIPGILDRHQTVKLGAGAIFGELAAMSRMPRSASVFAENECALLEIRWQGLRDLMKRDPALKARIDALYRSNSLEVHLQETPFIRDLPISAVREIADATEFESYGEFGWHTEFKQTIKEETARRIMAEPLICEEDTYVNGLVLIRSGFARLSRQYGDGHRTLAYLGKGQLFGLEEIAFNWKNSRQLNWQSSLRAVGHVDILRIPTSLVEQHILPALGEVELQELLRQAQAFEASATSDAKSNDQETSLLEFVLDQRVLNGTQTMLIDTHRCTRCDDCVRACASTHDGNPRFVREGPAYDRFMFAHACMHCADPVCMIGCPTGAIGREIASGAVMINDLTCIGCATCANSCPYENIKMVEVRDAGGGFILDDKTQQPLVKATKCDLCSDHWGGPACQRACPYDALVRIDLNDESKLLDWMHRS